VAQEGKRQTERINNNSSNSQEKKKDQLHRVGMDAQTSTAYQHIRLAPLRSNFVHGEVDVLGVTGSSQGEKTAGTQLWNGHRSWNSISQMRK
jgi:hypothetical protein